MYYTSNTDDMNTFLDLDKDNEVTEEEIRKATEILEKAKKKNRKTRTIKNLNNFMMQV